MDSHDEETNSVLNHMDAFRTNWITMNEKLREANNKIASLEAELSTVKNQLYHTTYEKDILNHTLNELRKALRADCKVIDQVQKNKSSYIRMAQHQSSLSEQNEQDVNQTSSSSLTTVDEISVSENLSDQLSDVAPINNSTSTSRSNQNECKLLIRKQSKLPSSKISPWKTSNTTLKASNNVTISSQNILSASEILREKTSPSNLKINAKKSIKSSSKIQNRDQSEAADLNGDYCDVIVIDFDDEAEENDARPDDIYISSDDVYLEDEDSDLTADRSNSVSKLVHSENEVDRSNSNKLIKQAHNSKINFLGDHSKNSDGRADKDKNDRPNTKTKKRNSRASSTRIGAARVQGDKCPPNSDAESSIGSNTGLTNSKAVHVRDENNTPVSNGRKSVYVNSDNKLPIILLSQLPVSKKISENKNAKGRKRKQLEDAKLEEMHDTKNAGKIKKSRLSSPLVSKPRSQNKKSSPSSSKKTSSPSKNILIERSSQKKKISLPPRTCFCKICNEMFTSGRSLSVHLNKSHIGDEKAFTCKICGFIMQSQSSFSTHLSSQHKKEKCIICEKENRGDTAYIEKSHLNSHILDNHPNPYPDYLRCPYRNGECNEHFTALNIYEKHVKNIHVDEDLSLPKEKIFPGHDFWTCSACGKLFSHAAHLMKHANKAHSKGQKVFSCEFCSFTASKLRYLKQHLKKRKLCFETSKDKKRK